MLSITMGASTAWSRDVTWSRTTGVAFPGQIGATCSGKVGTGSRERRSCALPPLVHQLDRCFFLEVVVGKRPLDRPETQAILDKCAYKKVPYSRTDSLPRPPAVAVTAYNAVPELDLDSCDGPLLLPLGDLAVDRMGNMFAVSADETVRKITPDGVLTTVAGSSRQNGSADGIGAAACFYIPQGVAVRWNGQPVCL